MRAHFDIGNNGVTRSDAGLGVTSLVNRGSGPSTVWTDVPSIAGEEFFYSVVRMRALRVLSQYDACILLGVSMQEL